HSFSERALWDLLKANTHSALTLKLYTNPIFDDEDYKTWADTLHTLDKELRNKDKRFEAKMTAGKADKKSLLSHLMDCKDSSSTTFPSANTSTSSSSGHARSHGLTEAEHALFVEFKGCNCFYQFFAGHETLDCPMAKNNTWPDWATY
ncbi:hypothetical protein CVT25_015116, partial [Psilocybe cyanescens]